MAENGFRSITLEELSQAMLCRRLPARTVVLTFDDGYPDFETEAWPRLRAVAIAYPYGDSDPVVEHLAGACGYTCEPRMASVDDQLLALPRVEVACDEPLACFLERMEIMA